MGNVFQSTYINPTVKSEFTFSLGLPAVSSMQFQLIHNGFTPNSFLTIEGNTLLISPNNLEEQLKNSNLFYTGFGLDLFHLKLSIKKLDIWYGQRVNMDMSFYYPKSMISMLIKGMDQFSGEKMDLSPLGMNFSVNREHTIGASAELGKFIVGGRLSMFQGITNAYLKPNSLGVTIDGEMYNLTVDSDAALYTSGIPGDSLMHPNFSQFTDIDFSGGFSGLMSSNAGQYLTRFRNPGFAFSGGVAYKLNSRTTFSFAVSDLGFITWSDSTKVFKIKGESNFNGMDALSGVLAGQSFSPDSLINDFVSNFDATEEMGESYKTRLNTKIYFSAMYQLARRTNVGFQFYGVYNREFYPAFTIGITQGLGRVINIALTASSNQRTMTNLGLGLMLKPGPFQIYMMADNLYAPIVDPLTFTNLNFRMGMNVVFGKVKAKQALPANP
jgi:hypothetical protein